MYLLILVFSALISTVAWYSMAENDRYLLRVLSLILWGASVMVFVDCVMGYLGGGEFIEMTVESAVLGFIMLIVAIGLWEMVLLLKDPKGVLYRRRIG